MLVLQMIKKEWRVVIDNWACEVVHLMCTVEVLSCCYQTSSYTETSKCNKSGFHCTCEVLYSSA